MKKEESYVKTETQKNKKTRASVLAGILAVALLLTGTFAWRSMSQHATNKIMDNRNPGGRVHDDFKGLEDKDVYAENFTDVTDGAPVFARIKLLEYMEIGEDAGIKLTYPDRRATPLVYANVNDTSTWQVYDPTAKGDKFREYWDWTFGGSADYLPTFNKNKDSLSVDVNGTYEGLDGKFESGIPYDDYEPHAAGEKVTRDTYYDNDSNDDDEYVAGTSPAPGAGGTENVNFTKRSEEHEVKPTLNSLGIMTMTAWKAAGSPVCNRWIYDDSPDGGGWFYWPKPIQPQTATGLLLDKVDQRMSAGEKSYYAIEVVGEFASAGQWGDENADSDVDKGFYLNEFSADAKALLDQATKAEVGADGEWYLSLGNSVYRKLEAEKGTPGELVCAGADKLIGTTDDRTDVVYVEGGLTIDGETYGEYFLEPTETEPYYRGTVSTNRLGTDTDICFWVTGGSFPDGDVTIEPVSGVTVTAAEGATTVKNGVPLTFTAEVATALDEKGVVWSVSGNGSEGTSISETGVLTANGENEGTVLTVTATSKLDETKRGSATVTVLGSEVVVTVSGESTTVPAGESVSFTGAVTVDGEPGDVSGLTWKAADVDGNPITGVSIENGVLSVNRTVEKDTVIYVSAAYGSTSSEVQRVTVLPERTEVVTLKAVNSKNAPITEVEAGVTGIKLSVASAVDKEGQPLDLLATTWSVSTTAPTRASADVTIVEKTGVLSIGDEVPAGTVITVKAQSYYTADRVGKVAVGTMDLTVAGPAEVVITAPEEDVTRVARGYAKMMAAEVRKADGSPYPSDLVTWTLEGATEAGTFINETTGELTVFQDEPAGTMLTVTVASVVDPSKTASRTFEVVAGYNGVPAEGETFEEDKQTFRVLYRDDVNHQALVLRETVLPKQSFCVLGESKEWRDSTIRTYLNGAYLDSLEVLKTFVKETDIRTRPMSKDVTGYITTQDQVFLLSEADIFGKIQGSTTTTVTNDDYTLGTRKVFFADSDARKAHLDGETDSVSWWTRSGNGSFLSYVASSGGGGQSGSSSDKLGVRPAFWIIIE